MGGGGRAPGAGVGEERRPRRAAGAPALGEAGEASVAKGRTATILELVDRVGHTVESGKALWALGNIEFLVIFKVSGTRSKSGVIMRRWTPISSAKRVGGFGFCATI